MPTNFLRYCCLVFCAAWLHSRSWTQGIIFFFLVIAGVATLLVPNFGMTIDTIDLVNILKNPTIYAILFGSVLSVDLFARHIGFGARERAARKSRNAGRGNVGEYAQLSVGPPYSVSGFGHPGRSVGE